MLVVSFLFFSKRKQPPALHNLVKFYLDELVGKAFRDDRQVGLIEADFHDGLEEEHFFIKVERLSDYLARFDAAFRLRSILSIEDERDWTFDPIDDEDFNELCRIVKPEVAAGLRQIRDESLPHKLFGRIERWDRPIVTDKDSHLSKLRENDLLAINLGELPTHRESKHFKERIVLKLDEFEARFGLLRRLRSPVILNVAVRAANKYPSKDLDNIVRDVAPRILKCSGNPSLLQGFRVYVAERSVQGLKTDSIQIKFLPWNAIFCYRRRIESFIEQAEEEIDLYR